MTFIRRLILAQVKSNNLNGFHGSGAGSIPALRRTQQRLQIAMAGVNADVQMEADIDSHAAAGAAVAAAAAAAAIDVGPTTPPPEHVQPPPANFEVMTQQQLMKFMQGMFA